MKRSGSPNAFEERLTKLICDRADAADSEKVNDLESELEEMKEQLEQAQNEIDEYQLEIDDIRSSVHCHMRELEELIENDIDRPSNPLGNFCCFCNHYLDDWSASQCHGTKCHWAARDLPCREWCFKRKGDAAKYPGPTEHYTCLTKGCKLRVCGTHCTVCRVCENKKK